MMLDRCARSGLSYATALAAVILLAGSLPLRDVVNSQAGMWWAFILRRVLGHGAVTAEASLSRLVRCRAASSTATQLCGVRCGASRHTAVNVSEPSARRSRMAGNRRAARAASMRP
jgi:hypothetical protein